VLCLLESGMQVRIAREMPIKSVRPELDGTTSHLTNPAKYAGLVIGYVEGPES